MGLLSARAASKVFALAEHTVLIRGNCIRALVALGKSRHSRTSPSASPNSSSASASRPYCSFTPLARPSTRSKPTTCLARSHGSSACTNRNRRCVISSPARLNVLAKKSHSTSSHRPRQLVSSPAQPKWLLRWSTPWCNRTGQRRYAPPATTCTENALSSSRGHFPGFGRARDPELDIVAQLRNWLNDRGLRVQRDCTKRRRPADRCPTCRPLFQPRRHGKPAAGSSPPTTLSPRRWRVTPSDAQPARQAATRNAFSGTLARKGGRSTAIEAGVKEVILYPQDRAARRYMQPRDPAPPLHAPP